MPGPGRAEPLGRVPGRELGLIGPLTGVPGPGLPGIPGLRQLVGQLLRDRYHSGQKYRNFIRHHRYYIREDYQHFFTCNYISHITRFD